MKNGPATSTVTPAITDIRMIHDLFIMHFGLFHQYSALKMLSTGGETVNQDAGGHNPRVILLTSGD